MFPQRIGVGIALLALTGVLLTGVVAMWTGPALAAPPIGVNPGETVYGSEVVMKAVARQEKTMEGRKALPGHGGFCPAKVKSVAVVTETRSGKEETKTALPGHGGFLAPGEEC